MIERDKTVFLDDNKVNETWESQTYPHSQAQAHKI